MKTSKGVSGEEAKSNSRPTTHNKEPQPQTWLTLISFEGFGAADPEP